MKRMAITVSIGVLIALATLGTPASALEPLVVYDDFKGKFIDIDKWAVGQECGFEAGECVREIQSSGLRLVDRAYGRTDSSTGNRFSGAIMNFPIPDIVTAVKTSILIKRAEVTGCPSNPSLSGTRAVVGGSFFNTGSPTPGSLLNDVMADIRIQRLSDSTDPANILRAITFVFHSSHPNGSAGTVLDSRDLGPIRLGQKATFLVQWDRANHRFIFQRDKNPQIVYDYSVSDAAPAGAPFRSLAVHNFPVNCMGGPRTVGYMEVLFDRVFVNESAAP